MGHAVNRGRSPREEQAHKFADAGWFSFPVEPGGKKPITPHGYLDASTDHRTIERWWRDFLTRTWD